MQLCSELPRHLRAEGLPSQSYIQMAKRSCNNTSRVLQFFLLVSGPRLRHCRHRPPTAVPSARQQTRHGTARLTRWSASCPAWPHNCKSGFTMREASGNAERCHTPTLKDDLLEARSPAERCHTPTLPRWRAWTATKPLDAFAQWVNLMKATTMAQLQMQRPPTSSHTRQLTEEHVHLASIFIYRGPHLDHG